VEVFVCLLVVTDTLVVWLVVDFAFELIFKVEEVLIVWFICDVAFIVLFVEDVIFNVLFADFDALVTWLLLMEV
jgi:hypothetical protein